jgi:hypothetical protein
MQDFNRLFGAEFVIARKQATSHTICMTRLELDGIVVFKIQYDSAFVASNLSSLMNSVVLTYTSIRLASFLNNFKLEGTVCAPLARSA